MNFSEFKIVTKKVIDTLEGGYYHPKMLADGRVKDQRYKNSGETMFGIDRDAGGEINHTSAGKKFWNLIDNAGASQLWKWNYKGGALADELKDLTAEMVFERFKNLTKEHLSEKAQKLVEKDNRLLFHFIYASWNGAGWFQKFAKKINEKVAAGITDTDELARTALQSRLNSGSSLIKQSGEKMTEIFGTMPRSRSDRRKVIIVLVIIGIIVIVFIVWHYRKPIGGFFKRIFNKK